MAPRVRGAMPRRLRLGRPAMASAPPAMASTTYWMWPMLLFTGPRMLLSLLAWVAFSHNSSLRRSNSALAISSWLNTFTTFWPLIISSM